MSGSGTPALFRGAEDERRLVSYLAERLPELGPIEAVSRLAGGQSNPTYRLETARAFYVLRKKPDGPLLPSAHQIEREYRVMKTLASSRVPVPEMLHFCDDPGIIGTAFYVMQGVGGRIFRDTTLPEVARPDRRAIYLAAVRTLADIHAVDWRAAGLGDFGKSADYIRRQISRWTRQFQAAKTHEIPAMDRLIERLPQHVPAEEQVALVHGDFRIENLVFDAVEPRVAATLDWELATLGHPLADLAYNCMIYYLPRELTGLGGVADVDLAAAGIPSEQDYVAAYCARTGRPWVRDWNFFLAFSMFRSAAILQGVLARSRQNNAAADTAAAVGMMAAPVAEAAWRALVGRDEVGR